MRIVSLVPSATEIVYALGLGDDLVGVTHACDYPPPARKKPTVTSSTLTATTLTSAEIDAQVAAQQVVGEGVYHLDVERLAELRPDLIFTQGLCDVCAVPHGVVRRAVPSLPTRPRVYSSTPSVGDVLSNVKTVGDATGSQARARVVIAELRARIDRITLQTAGLLPIPRVFCLEWLDPPWTAGHWVPEMVGMAGGYDALGGSGQPSRRTDWREIARFAPEVVVVMPCGFDLEKTRAEFAVTAFPAEWSTLPAVRDGRVWAVDGSAYFNRPGPRLVDGLEILAGIIHPERFDAPRADAACVVSAPP